MIDNFKLIEKLIYFDETSNLFFHCQIIRRTKDSEDTKGKNKHIGTYFIKSVEQLNRLKKEIVLLCEHYKARAYINVATKSFNDMQKLILKKVVDNVVSNTIQNPMKLINSAAGELKPNTPSWVIDIDDVSIKDNVLKWLDNYYNIDVPPHHYTRSFYLRTEIPTVHGCHLIVIPFNLEEFKKAFTNVDVHKNSMGTLLYYPESLGLPKYCCSVCGGTNIQLLAWIDANTNEYISDTEDDECWCEDCEKHTKIKLYEK